jgi:hypothetical protein
MTPQIRLNVPSNTATTTQTTTNRNSPSILTNLLPQSQTPPPQLQPTSVGKQVITLQKPLISNNNTTTTTTTTTAPQIVTLVKNPISLTQLPKVNMQNQTVSFS